MQAQKLVSLAPCTARDRYLAQEHNKITLPRVRSEVSALVFMGVYCYGSILLRHTIMHINIVHDDTELVSYRYQGGKK